MKIDLDIDAWKAIVALLGQAQTSSGFFPIWLEIQRQLQEKSIDRPSSASVGGEEQGYEPI